jgi:hypothetical protein
MQFPDAIEARCMAGRRAFPETWLTLTLESTEADEPKAFSFAFGPGRGDGRLLLSREDVLAQARYLEQSVGLDYGRLEDRWQGRGWIAVAGAAELRHQFRLTFAKPALLQASTHRIAAARALRFLYENDDEPLSVAIESELPGDVDIVPVSCSPADWLPEELHEPVSDLLSMLAQRDFEALIEADAIESEAASRIEQEIVDRGAHPVTPPDIGLLLASATDDGEEGWTIETPLWTREEGPSDLVLRIHAHEHEQGLELELRGTAPR